MPERQRSAGKTHMSEHQERNPAVEKALRELGRFIGKTLPEGWGFTLQIFSYGEGGALFYLSSAERADMLRMMQEFIAKQEGSPQ